MLSKEFSIVKSNLTYAINGLTSNKIKSLIGRERLKHTKKQILNYLYIHVYAIFYKVNYKFIYDKITKKDKTLSETLNSGNFDIKINITVKYSTFMHNLNLYAILFKYVFVFNRNYILSLLFSKNNYLIIDSTLINTKKNIVGSDYKKKNVTIRNKKSICGFKLFSATNKHNKILFVNIENINYSDYNFLRAKQLNFDDYEYLLVDRGFNS